MNKRTFLSCLAFFGGLMYTIRDASARNQVLSRTTWVPPAGASAVRVRSWDENGNLVMDRIISIEDQKKFQIEAIK
jgi:hypothetical protein